MRPYLVGNKVFADIINLRGGHTRLEWTLNPVWFLSLCKVGNLDTERHRAEHCITTEVERLEWCIFNHPGYRTLLQDPEGEENMSPQTAQRNEMGALLRKRAITRANFYLNDLSVWHGKHRSANTCSSYCPLNYSPLLWSPRPVYHSLLQDGM